VKHSARVLTAILGVAFAAACGETVAPLPQDDYELPPPDLSLDPERLSVGEHIAHPCAFSNRGGMLIHLRDRHEWALVDIFFHVRSAASGPGPEDLQLVRDHGGRILHEFQTPAVRARMILSRIPDLVLAGDWVTVRDVPDATRYDVPDLNVEFHQLTDEHVDFVTSLGGRVTYRYDLRNWLKVVLPDVSVPQLVQHPDVRFAEIPGWLCSF